MNSKQKEDIAFVLSLPIMAMFVIYVYSGCQFMYFQTGFSGIFFFSFWNLFVLIYALLKLTKGDVKNK